jgi:hypothetical protein
MVKKHLFYNNRAFTQDQVFPASLCGATMIGRSAKLCVKAFVAFEGTVSNPWIPNPQSIPYIMLY